MHRLDDAPRLFLHAPGQIGINDVVSCHGVIQRFVIQNIALDHTHTLLVPDLLQALGIPQIESELHIRLLKE